MASDINPSGRNPSDPIAFSGSSQTQRATSAGGSSAAATLPSADQLKRQASEMKGQAKQGVSDAVDQATAGAQQMKEQLGQRAADAAKQLREKGQSLLGEQKTRAASTLEEFGNAIDAAGCRLEKDNDDAIAGYVHGAADQVRVLSTYLNDKPVEALVKDAIDLARRKPEYFVGGMFVVGLALARFAKSGTAQTPRAAGSGGNGSGYGRDYGQGYPNPSYGDLYGAPSRSSLPAPGHDVATGGHEIVNPYAVPDAPAYAGAKGGTTSASGMRATGGVGGSASMGGDTVDI